MYAESKGMKGEFVTIPGMVITFFIFGASIYRSWVFY